MNNYFKILTSVTLISASIFLILQKNIRLAKSDETLASRLKGRILLQVEKNGEAWYLNPENGGLFFLGRPIDAFRLMKYLSTGISETEIKKIPVADENPKSKDSDGDGLSDASERGLGTDPADSDSDDDGYDDKTEILAMHDPRGEGSYESDKKLSARLSGKIIMQSQKNGEAWYVNPIDKKRYFLGTPENAFILMKKLGLGISDKDLAVIDKSIIEPISGSDYSTSPTGGNEITYNDKAFGFSFDYPSGWKLKKYEGLKNTTHITDAISDFVYEKKGYIGIFYIASNEIDDISAFKVASKGKDIKTLSDKSLKINGFPSYQNSYDYEKIHEKTTTIRVGKGKFIQISLATAKNNNSYYEKIYSEILNSLKTGND